MVYCYFYLYYFFQLVKFWINFSAKSNCGEKPDADWRITPGKHVIYLEPASKTVGCVPRTDASLNEVYGAWDAPYENRNRGLGDRAGQRQRQAEMPSGFNPPAP